MIVILYSFYWATQTLFHISFRNHFFEMLLTLLERDWLADQDTLGLSEEHIIVEKNTINQTLDTLIFPRESSSSHLTVNDLDLLGRTYQGVLLRGEFIKTLYEYESQIQYTVSDILYFGFLDQNETSVSLDFHYIDSESVFDNKSRCLVLQEVGDEDFEWTNNLCYLLAENRTDIVCQCEGITNTLNYAGFRSGPMNTSTTSSTTSTEPTATSTTRSTSNSSSASTTSTTTGPTSTLSTDTISTSTSTSCQWTFSKTLLIVAATFLSISLLLIFSAFFAILVFFK